MSNCPAIPPEIVPSGKYVIVVDEVGNTRILARPSNASLLVFDGTNIYFADGSVETPILLSDLSLVNESVNLSGVIAIREDGSIVRWSNEGAITKSLLSENGTIRWGTPTFPPTGLPVAGKGIVVRTAADVFELLSTVGIPVLDADGDAAMLPHGTSGQVLTMEAGLPVWRPLPAASVASGSAGLDIGGVVGLSTSNSAVNIKVPSFNLTDGTDNLTVVNVDVTVNLANANGLLGLDTGTEAASTWYYIYITSDGTNVSAIISEDPTLPDLSATTHTYYGLASVFRNHSNGNIIQFTQKGRRFATEPRVGISDGNTGVTLGALNFEAADLDELIPPNCKTVSGTVGGGPFETAARNTVLASSSGGIGLQHCTYNSISGSNSFFGFYRDIGSFRDLPIINPLSPVIYGATNTVSASRKLSVTGYTV